ncbi:hypothetical protein I203_101499 [Kwoniella mangroviensis CBS 8507]|uniref:uncharacterized protein n=1 Tax=Kwoniella mangroviensis CBS 8507 TaxID=1296122 RepID=UPI00080D57A6|nr:uncharacterized protein I203_05551 [Kwoniella mangroviensis CBS 8507]OCF65305.1 hypothetical protein I203_05551 [Kwoniella mangroviensis CBS 8507]
MCLSPLIARSPAPPVRTVSKVQPESSSSRVKLKRKSNESPTPAGSSPTPKRPTQTQSNLQLKFRNPTAALPVPCLRNTASPTQVISLGDPTSPEPGKLSSAHNNDPHLTNDPSTSSLGDVADKLLPPSPFAPSNTCEPGDFITYWRKRAFDYEDRFIDQKSRCDILERYKRKREDEDSQGSGTDIHRLFRQREEQIDRERDEWQSEIKALKEDLEKKIETIGLAQERQEISETQYLFEVAIRETLTKERDDLQSEKNELVLAKSQVESAYEKYQSQTKEEYSKLDGKIKELVNERNGLSEKLNASCQEKTSLEMELKQTREERDTSQQNYENLESFHEKLYEFMGSRK